MVIAEIGINHNGSIQRALEMMKQAKLAGADFVKFQKRNVDLAVPDDMKDVVKETPWGEMTYLEYKKRMEFGKSEYDMIDSYAKHLGIQWFASVWDIDSYEFIKQYKVPFIKIASATLTDDALLYEIARDRYPTILSTGMSRAVEVSKAVSILGRENLVLMACTSTYPTKDEEVNLRGVQTLKSIYGTEVGFSSHSADIMPPSLAVMYDAEYIEVHVTLDRDLWGTDQASSLDFYELKQLTDNIKRFQTLKGDGIIKCYESEVPIKNKLRRI